MAETTGTDGKDPGATVSEQEARQVAEAARETEWTKPSFVRELFLGDLRLDLIHPPPEPTDPEEQKRAAAFMAEVKRFLQAEVDPDEIERDKKIPERVLQGLKRAGAFGMKIPLEYGGLGLSQASYNRAVAYIGTYSTALGVLLSAHQSIGVPQPLKMFGTEAQKKKYLPRLAAGAVSAFALTEPDVGSDPARVSATAEPTADGEAYILNGEKLWTTNGPIAELIVVMARTPARDSKRRGITAFIVESSWPGVDVTHRLDFMGLNGIENGVLRFTNVRVPRENVLWGEGRGLKLALTTLNTGRLTIPALCAASAKWCLEVVRNWSNERVQWGVPIGKHEAIAAKIADIAGYTFAMEAMAELSAGLADAGHSDIRLEAAIAKMFNSEAAWRIIDDTIQIRGGRGYETADSLASRGEPAIPVERVMRDLRINLIFEGSSEIMRLFIAREAVDPHISSAGAFLQPQAPAGDRVKGLLGLGAHLAGWVPGLYVGWGRWPRYESFGPLDWHLRFADRAARKLARTIFYAMTRYGASLERRQSVLFRIVDIGAELFAISATCVYAQKKVSDSGDRSAYEVADVFCRGARRRIHQLFRDVFENHDARKYRVAQHVLKGRHTWLESGPLSPGSNGGHPSLHVPQLQQVGGAGAM